MKGNIGLLGMVAAGLLVLVVLDRLQGSDRADGPVDSTQGQNPERAEQPNPSALPQAVLDHPLFQPSRSAGASVVAAPLVLPSAADTPAPPQDPPVLVGVVIDPAPGGAFLTDSAEGRVVYLEPGQASGGLQLLSVSRDRAVFQGATGEVTLLLPTAIELSGP